MVSSSEDLADITFMRIALETAALRRSMHIGDGKWEGGIVSALHQMKRIAGQSRILQNSPELDAVHKDFHVNLIAACGSPRIGELASHPTIRHFDIAASCLQAQLALTISLPNTRSFRTACCRAQSTWQQQLSLNILSGPIARFMGRRLVKARAEASQHE
jgi:hypothetical protein